MSSRRHYPLGSSPEQLRVFADQVWAAIEKTSGQATTAHEAVKQAVSGGGFSSVATSVDTSIGSGSSAAADAIGERRKIEAVESIILDVKHCMTVVDYLECDGSLELQDTSLMVLG